MGYWLKSKCIVIIGGTTGIGISAAKAFLQVGANLILVGMDEGESGSLAHGWQKKVFVRTADARQEETASQAIEMCLQKFGSFDGLYHIAGGSGRKFGDGPLHEMSKEAWDQTFNLNLSSLMLSNRAAVRSFMELGKGGSILNLTTALAYSPSPHYFTTHAYAAAKSAVIGLVKSTAAYYAPFNIRINALAPGLIETPMSQRAMGDEAIVSYVRSKQPLDGGRPGRPDDLDGAAIYFMSDTSRFTTGQIMAVDGGWGVSEGKL